MDAVRLQLHVIYYKVLAHHLTYIRPPFMGAIITYYCCCRSRYSKIFYLISEVAVVLPSPSSLCLPYHRPMNREMRC